VTLNSLKHQNEPTLTFIIYISSPVLFAHL